MRIPTKLKPGDELRVLALSRSLGGVMQQAGITESDVQFATSRLELLGLNVSFGQWVRESNEHLTASVEHRLEDFHTALLDPSVKAILAVTGGVGAIQLVNSIDYKLVAANLKIICGYSDIAYFCNAIWASTGVVTYYGPNFTSFMMRKGVEYTLQYFRRCLFEGDSLDLQPADCWSDDAWHRDQENRTFHSNEGFWAIQKGEAEGAIIGGSYWCLNMLQGTAYFPSLKDTILFLEHPAEGKATLMGLDSGLRALSMQPGFSEVRGIVLGRYSRSGDVTREKLTRLISAIPSLKHLPVAANADFGHTTPIFPIPIGGGCALRVEQDRVAIRFRPQS